MWASSLSHNGLTGCGASVDFTVHQIEHELSGMFDVTHGAGLAAVWATWARYVYKVNPLRFAQLGKEMFGITYDASPAEIEKAAVAAIDKTEAFFKSLGMPISVGDMGIKLTDKQVKELAWKCSFFGARKVGFFKPLEIPDLEEIYRRAK
jgi:alcohol dehydrogenase YqhD (iron-dependent ADH family)